MTTRVTATPSDASMPITIDDLPAELLREIVSHLHSPIPRNCSQNRFDWRGRHGDDHSRDIQAVKSARLTCRRFNEAASQFLLPCVSVSVDQASLSRLETLLESPLIASGVSCVSVDLSCYPQEAVTSLQAFMERQKYDIKNEQCYLRHTDRFGYRPHCDTLHADGEGDCHDFEDNIRSRTRRLRRTILGTWRNAQDEEPRPGVSSSPDYFGILEDAYHAFKAAHKEQADLTSSGLFSKTLASLISRLPNFRELRLYDHPKSPRSKHDPIETFSNPELLKRFLTTPYNWSAAQDDLAPRTMEIPTASLLRDLPIAIHEAGSTIRHVRIAKFPVFIGDVLLFDISEYGDRFRTALHALERFELFGHSRRSRTRDTPTPWLEKVDAITDRYLSAVTSRPLLRELELSFGGSERYPASAPISALASENITNLWLQHVWLQQCDFDHLCSQVSHAAERLCLFGVGLSDGSWTPGVEVLREKTVARCEEETCLVEAERLDGGKYHGNGEWVSMKNWRRRYPGRYVGPPFVLPRAPVATALSSALNALISEHSEPPVARSPLWLS